MKKYLLAAVALAAFTGLSFAQEPAPAAAPAAAPAKLERPARKQELKKVEKFAGEITVIDAAANTITVKDAKGVEKKFTLEAGRLAGLSQGEKVKVTVKDGRTSVKAKKKHEGKPEEKKAEGKKPEAPKTKAAN